MNLGPMVGPNSGQEGSKANLARVLAIATLLSCLTLPPLMPELANIAYFALATLAFTLALIERKSLWFGPASALLLLGYMLVAIASLFSGATPAPLLVFAPLLFVAPLSWLFSREGSVEPGWIGLAAGGGVALALLVAVRDWVSLGTIRAGESVGNPIHFADVVVSLGFVALVGLFSRHLWIRLVVIPAPVLAVVAILLSGSKGPLLAAMAMAVVATIAMVRVFRPPTAWIFWSGGAVVLCLAVGFFVMQAGYFQRAQILFELPGQMFSGQVKDASTLERIAIYQASWTAFLDAPFFGHGLAELGRAVNQYAPARYDVSHYDHLHSDVLDFAVGMGAAGLVAYLMFILTPFWLAARGHLSGPAGYLAIVLTTGYIVMGLTNATFGILSLTTLFAFLTALVNGMGRSDGWARAGTARPHD